jgi:hypothetical protein
VNQIHEGDDDDMGVGDHGSKNISSTRVFLHHCCTEFWKFDRLVAKQGDGCLDVALKTI